jgi:hypothetical protein
MSDLSLLCGYKRTCQDDGTVVPLTEGSTRPVAESRSHAGICKVKRYAFDLL